MNFPTAALFGFIGGITRASVGILKHKAYTKKKFKISYFLWTVLLSGIIGIFCGLFFINDYRFTLLAGYAGTDLIEGLYKSFRKKL
jgi:hypothetical protein